MRKTLTLALAWLLLIFAAACASMRVQATDARVLERLLLRHADTRISGVQKSEYPALAAQLGAYLAGKAETPQITVMAKGSAREAYSAHELAHLADVAKLVWLSVPAALSGFALWAAITFFVFRAGARARTAVRGALCAGGVVLLLCALAAADFNAAFTVFHKLLFTNDLWLLDPRTDLLIQLMPESLFVQCAVIVAISCLTCAILPIAALLLRERLRK